MFIFKGGTIVSFLLIFQVRTLRLREAKQVGQGLTANDRAGFIIQVEF